MSENEENKRLTEYEKLGIEPKTGGKSLLHNELGQPKAMPVKDKGMPPPDLLPNEPVLIKAKRPGAKIPAVVGENHDHLWHTTAVTGVPEKNVERRIVTKVNTMMDDDEDIDTDALQGLNPLSGIEPDKVHPLITKTQSLKTKISQQLKNINTIDEYMDFANNIFGDKGPIESLTNTFEKQPKNIRVAIGDSMDSIFQAIRMELMAKRDALKLNKKPKVAAAPLPPPPPPPVEEEEEEEEDSLEEPGQEPSYHEDNEDEEEDEELSALPNNKIADGQLLDEGLADLSAGQYAVIDFVNNKFLLIVEKEELNRTLEKLIIEHNVPIENLMVLKRVSVDFGVNVSE